MNFCLGPFALVAAATYAKARVGLGQLKSEGSKCGPFALVAAARLRCCCNLRKSKGRVRPTHKRGKQMRPFCLGFARLRCCCNLRKSKGRLGPSQKRGEQMEAHKRGKEKGKFLKLTLNIQFFFVFFFVFSRLFISICLVVVAFLRVKFVC
jgi:hypothetical protein